MVQDPSKSTSYFCIRNLFTGLKKFYQRFDESQRICCVRTTYRSTLNLVPAPSEQEVYLCLLNAKSQRGEERDLEQSFQHEVGLEIREAGLPLEA